MRWISLWAMAMAGFWFSCSGLPHSYSFNEKEYAVLYGRVARGGGGNCLKMEMHPSLGAVVIKHGYFVKRVPPGELILSGALETYYVGSQGAGIRSRLSMIPGYPGIKLEVKKGTVNYIGTLRVASKGIEVEEDKAHADAEIQDDYPYFKPGIALVNLPR